MMKTETCKWCSFSDPTGVVPILYGLCPDCLLIREHHRYRCCRQRALKAAKETAKLFKIKLPPGWPKPRLGPARRAATYDQQDVCWICRTPLPDCDECKPFKCDSPIEDRFHFRCFREHIERIERPDDEIINGMMADILTQGEYSDGSKFKWIE